MFVVIAIHILTAFFVIVIGIIIVINVITSKSQPSLSLYTSVFYCEDDGIKSHCICKFRDSSNDWTIDIKIAIDLHVIFV
jgi:hypothetical protein